MMHLTGLGKMRPNTVVIGFKNNWTDKRYRNDLLDYLGVIYDAFELNFGLVILRMNGKEKASRRKLTMKVKTKRHLSSTSRKTSVLSLNLSCNPKKIRRKS